MCNPESVCNLFLHFPFQVKSEVIATYALCGFANFGSIGITIGAVGALVPNKKSDLVKMVVRAMICGNVACFLTACVAGMKYCNFTKFSNRKSAANSVDTDQRSSLI